MPDVEPLIFKEKEHRYFTKSGKELISCSKLIHKYSPEFDPKGEIIAGSAKKKGKTVEELRKEWDYERDSANEKGTNFHKQAEYWVENKQIQDSDYKDVILQLSKFPFKGQLQSETTIYSQELGIAGTVDLIDWFDNNCDVLDFKTNKKLKKLSFFRKGYEMMLYPVNHLMNCNFVHYSLQQEIYAIILEENGYWVENKTLLYINPKTRLIEQHPVQPLREEAMNIIKHYRGEPIEIKKSIADEFYDEL